MKQTLKARIIISVICISFTQGLQFAISPVLNKISTHYRDTPVSLIQMLISAPSIIAMVIALISGYLVLHVSKKKLILFALFISGVSGFLPFLADSFALLFASRMIFGIGLGLAVALNATVVTDFFEGQERVQVMGIQAASIGGGMLIESTISGIVGEYGFKNAYFIYAIGFLACILVAILLPDKKVQPEHKTAKIRINRKVIQISILSMISFLFMITFTTNIAMHISTSFAKSASIAGILTGIFAGAQIVIGLVLGSVTKVTGKYSLPVAMFCFTSGALLLFLFPASLIFLLLGAALCGIAQGMFIPQAMCEISNAVEPIAATMAVACLTCGNCIGQILSPVILNGMTVLIFHKFETGHVYLIGAVGMAVAALVVVIRIRSVQIKNR